MTLNEFSIDIMPYLITAITLTHMYFVGRNTKNIWLWVIPIQIVWIAFSLMSKTYGFLPLQLGMMVIGMINHKRQVIARTNQQKETS